MKSESLARGGVMTMTSMSNLDGCSRFGGVCAACVGSQVGWVCSGGLVWPWACVVCLLLGGLVPFVSVFARFPPKKPDTFFLINRIGQCLLPPFQKKKKKYGSIYAQNKY
jgi:hypothetical protein